MAQYWFPPLLRKHVLGSAGKSEHRADLPPAQRDSVGNLTAQNIYTKSTRSRRLDSPRSGLVPPTIGRGGVGEEDGHAPMPLQQARARRGANPGGRGPGRMSNSSESFYDVNGPTLTSITGQLNQAGGFGAETNAPIGMGGRIRPERLPDGSFRAEIPWQISGASTLLPRWVDYDTACAAAQAEWDRFMQQTRAHEQAAHVDAAYAFIASLGSADTVITGATVAELQQNLEAKQGDLGQRLQAIHDACTHGVDVDAILHPDNGNCEGT